MPSVTQECNTIMVSSGTINPSQVILFQVSQKNTKSNGRLFYLCLLPLGLRDDSEVEINDILGKNLKRHLFVPSSRVEQFSSHVFSHRSLKLVEANPLR